MKRFSVCSNRIVSFFLAVVLVLTCVFCVSLFDVRAEESIEKNVYDDAKNLIYNAAKKLEPEVDLSSLDIPSSYAKELYMDTLLSYPELLYLSETFSSSNVSAGSSGNIDKITLTYINSSYNLAGRIDSLRICAENFKENCISGSMSEVEKYLSIFEFLCANTLKNKGSLLVSHFDSTAFGPLMEGYGDSLGYALAFKYLADYLGLDSFVVFGKDDPDQYWNAVEIDGYYFYVDAFSADNENSKTVSSDVTTKVSTVDHYMFMSDEASFAVLNHIEGTSYGYGDPIRVRGASKLPFKQYWSGVTSPMVYLNGDWYCISNLSPDVILKRSPDQNYVGVNEKAFYKNANPIGSIASDGKYIYFTNLDAEVRTCTASGDVKTIYDAYGFNRRVGDIGFDGEDVVCNLYTDTGTQLSPQKYDNGENTTIKTVTYGDLNGDKVIDNTDYSIICEYIKNGVEIDASYKGYADIDRNGVINTFDRVYIARYLAGETLIADMFFN